MTSLDLPTVADFLASVGVRLAGPLTAELIAGGRSNLTYRVSDGEMSWVLRRPPAAGRTASAHDVAREAHVTRALMATVVPVAPVIALCENPDVLGAPFSVTAWVEGKVLRERADLDTYSDTDISGACTALVEVLAALHEVDPRSVGLEGWGRPDGFVARQVALWRRQWEQVKTRELVDVETLHQALEARVPGSSAVAIVHGDYRIDNAILDAHHPSRVLAIVDWELSTLGDPCTDVALMCTYRSAALDAILGIPAAWASPRPPSPDALADAYAARAGRDLGDWNFYLALAHFKLAVIAEGIAYRAREGADAGQNAARAAQAVPELVSAGLAHLAR